MLTLLESFNRRKFELLLVLFESSEDEMDSLPGDIRVINLNKKGSGDFFGLIWKLAAVMRQERPSVVLSFLWYANVIAIIARKISRVNIPVIISARNYTSIAIGNQRWGRFKLMLTRLSYPAAFGVAAPSKAMAMDLKKNFKVKESGISIIPNPLDTEKISRLSSEEPGHPWFNDNTVVIVSVGRLHKQKGYRVLLKAFAKLQNEYPARLVILGEGEERPALERLIGESGLGSCVQLPGFVKNPYPYMKNANLFVISSLYEGFPNALLEAMACGTPVVSTACPSGPDEIITNGINGLLVPVADESALYSAMVSALYNADYGNSMAEKAQSDVLKYSVKKIVGRYEDMLMAAAKKETNGKGAGKR